MTKMTYCYFIIFFLAGCSSSSKQPDKFYPIQSETISGVIVPEEEGFCFSVTEPEYWTIENDFDFENLDDQLEKYLKVELEYLVQKQEIVNTDLLAKFRAYKRQYVGIYADGKKRIFINFFDSEAFSDETNWKNNPIVVDDGGDAFFQVQFDLASKEFMFLCINGEA
ncbi:hypothetical protein ACFL54_07860 [Planctomycetota bacterium]